MRSEQCDTLCGGAGCPFCGGITCENGAMNKVEQALDYGTDAENKIREKERQSDTLLRNVSKFYLDESQLYYLNIVYCYSP